ncbi:hypothetical protein LOTGIDRAFT_173565 [Lottia gigantea]|uniref:Uncharacterized protein n=1 Tax=Lottia gigantea TaxID=225164 RepID=V4AR51_LOTGI|nr:hypothetical protein LOTGIDRAFT_173565 [Lottia gigantea]ESO99727.1 hypothetical protein LOTGIDRAFT_173565 [Lottia gigantea]
MALERRMKKEKEIVGEFDSHMRDDYEVSLMKYVVKPICSTLNYHTHTFGKQYNVCIFLVLIMIVIVNTHLNFIVRNLTSLKGFHVNNLGRLVSVLLISLTVER